MVDRPRVCLKIHYPTNEEVYGYMKTDSTKYDRVYKILKNKIVSGLLPIGTKLPGRASLCKHFNTSERTIRKVMEMLVQDGLLEIEPKRRPTVVSNMVIWSQEIQENMEKADSDRVDDILKTGIILCQPINRHGMLLCSGDEWNIPEKILENMNPDKPIEFWRLSNRLWRFFIARNENELILRVVDSLGFGEVDLLPKTFEIRKNYKETVRKLLQTIKSGGVPDSSHFDEYFIPYGIVLEKNEGTAIYKVTKDSPLSIGGAELEKELRKAQERYSNVYMDIMGLIAIGRYQPGDYLPTHEQLQEIYDVSIDTTVKAIKTLKDWGVVSTAPRRGICVTMDLEGLQKIHIEPEIIACHVRRYLDSLELLSLTVKGAASHAISYATAEEAKRLYRVMFRQWNEPYQHHLIPSTLLDFIVDHIQHKALKSIYQMIQRNYSIGRSIPLLMSRDKNLYHKDICQSCLEVVNILISKDSHSFAEQSADIFETVYKLTISECKRLRYWEASMQVYSGTALWK